METNTVEHLSEALSAVKKSRILKFLASIELGVVIIIALGTLTAWGTFVEAQYNDATAAKKIVYNSIWMYATMAALAICLIAVMVDRWPWQKKHTGFVLAHIGILILLAGSILTRLYGIDGSMALGIGEKSRFVLNEETVLAAYASLGDESGFRKIGEAKVDFFVDRPSEAKPFELPLAGGSVSVVGYYPYAFSDEKTVETNREGAGAAVRFQLQNSRVSLTEWLVQPGKGRAAGKNLGPAEVVLAEVASKPVPGTNVIFLTPHKSDPELLEYEIHTAREAGKPKRGKIRAGAAVETGWMGLTLRILKYMPHAEKKVSFKPVDQASPMTSAAIKIKYRGDEHWLGEGAMLKLFTDQAAYVVSYGRTRTDVGFDLSLKDFRVGRYQGTMRAASYESLVDVPGMGERLISMNEPLKHNGFTFYQSSFQEDEQGRPVASVLSVNRDPGRWIKYLGSALIVLGTIHLFYFKRRAARGAAKA